MYNLQKIDKHLYFCQDIKSPVFTSGDSMQKTFSRYVIITKLPKRKKKKAANKNHPLRNKDTAPD